MRKRTHDSNDLFDEKELSTKTTDGTLSLLGDNPWEEWTYKKEIVPISRVNNVTINKDKTITLRTKWDNQFKNINSKMANSVYLDGNSYTSFSGADSIVSIIFKGGAPVILGELQTFTYSIYRPTIPVFSLGSARPTGFTKGPRTIAGTLIFTVFDRNVLVAALHKAFQGNMAECLDQNILSDQLPPFDFQITFLNEYGQSSVITLYGVKITSEGQVQSIEDLVTENTVQYLARSIELMAPDVYENT